MSQLPPGVIQSGTLKKRSPKGFLGLHMWQERYFVLWEHQLCYYKRKEDVGDESKCLGYLLVENMSGVVRDKKHADRFKIILEGVDRQFELDADSDVLAVAWYDAIQAVLKKYGKAPVSLANNTTPSGNSLNSTKFWKPKIHQKLQMQRRQAIMADAMDVIDAATLAKRKFTKTDSEKAVIMEALHRCLAFKIMDLTAREDICALMWEANFAKGDIVYTEGQNTSIMYIITQGSFKTSSAASTAAAAAAATTAVTVTPPPAPLSRPTLSLPPPPPPPGRPSAAVSPTNRPSMPPPPPPPSRPSAAVSPSHASHASTSTAEASRNLFLTLSNNELPPDSPLASRRDTPNDLLTTGNWFGELALLYENLATQTVTAHEASKCFAIDRVHYKRIIAAASEQRFQRRVAFLRTTALLSQLPEALLKQVAEALEERIFAPGEAIIQQDEVGDALYIIQSGEASAMRDGVEVHRFSVPGEYFGEKSLVKKEARGATISTVTPVSVLYLMRADFVALLGKLEETTKNGVRKYSILNRALELNDNETADPSHYSEEDLERPIPVPDSDDTDEATDLFESVDTLPIPPPPPEIPAFHDQSSIPPPPPPPSSEIPDIPIPTFSELVAASTPAGIPTLADLVANAPPPPPPNDSLSGPGNPHIPTLAELSLSTPAQTPVAAKESTRATSPSVATKEPVRPISPSVAVTSPTSPSVSKSRATSTATVASPTSKTKASTSASPSSKRGSMAVPATPVAAPRPECPVKSLADLRVVGTLGRGTFGHVQLVADKAENTYALKAVNKSHVVRHNQVPHILSERAVMVELDHPFIVRLHRTMHDKSYVYFLLEPALGGELFSLLRIADRFDNDTARFYAAIVVVVFQYLHNKDILYRDLKPENLLIDPQGYIKFTDFGFAKKTKDRSYTFCGTPEYLPPEIISGSGHFRGVDFWALGVLIYEMLVGYTPFYDDAGPTQMYSRILAGKVVFPPGISPAAQDVIRGLLQPKPTRRLGVLLGGAEVIKNHPWFKGFDWAALMNKTLPAPIPVNVKDKYDISNFDTYDEENEEEEDLVDPTNPDWDKVF